MASPIRRRDGWEQEENNHRWKTFDDHEDHTAMMMQPQIPHPTADPSETNTEMIQFTDVSSPSRWGPPQGMPTSGFATITTALTTSTSASSIPPAYPENAQPVRSATPTPIWTQDDFSSTMATSTAGVNDYPSTQDDEGRSGMRMTPIVAGVISLVVMAVVGLLVFLCLRKRKQKQRQIQASQAKMQEMKARSLVSTNPVLGTSPTYTQSPMYTQSPTYAQYAAPLNSPRPANLATPPPVILGPIVPGSNGAYFTGIDTSDMVSMHDQQRPGPDRTGLGNPFADGDSLNEEPPPPYRPRSLAPMSRNTSVRTPRAASSQTYLIRGHDSARSPFADPRDDDVISEMSGPTLLRGNSYNDGMSVVSDMSYQETPVVARPSI